LASKETPYKHLHLYKRH